MRLVMIADTHERHGQVIVPDGDVLIHAGDITMIGEPDQITRFGKWFKSQPHKHKCLIAGNHDLLFENALHLALTALLDDWRDELSWQSQGLYYLEDDSVTIDGVKFFGLPWTPTFQGNPRYTWVFNADAAKQEAVTDAIPSDTDVLISHGPPHGILDRSLEGVDCGSRALKHRLAVVKPKICVFGHIHETYGSAELNGTKYYNATVVNRAYEVTNAPWVVDL